MTQYIDKDALVAEINKRIIDAPINNIGHQRVWAYNDVKDIINTLEVKYPELTWEDVREICTQSVLVEIDLGGLVSDERHYTEVLKRFKAQKSK